ncbi:uncharacterized protein C8Q71DRAFT_853042 [Rhodofomes roseus]|uniref:Mitochondrial adapter protein MCP1 transmembrane domain-containing protein n=1 Tax=Rhodofomes roseus TaxID=34475 RepID=A0ABQ8KTT6_9APHY|nr:uncharacterized protein C8Q71DRAFT_853042 [Rhodofomes roseus]KAH9842493.1 hypothetical protein C8Q71DRAFT_853042 [Rhodofomes roseus]
MSGIPNDSESSSTRPAPAWQRAAQTILTRLSHGSTPFITTFVLIHLTAPALASLGGTTLSSQVMLLGREYYQTPFGEKYLVLLPLLVHPLSSLAKRLLAPRPARRATSVLSLAGYAATLLLAVHFLTHRVHPADAAPPVLALSPAELDYEYVKYALQAWPWRAWFGYVALTAAVAGHAAEGAKVVWNTWLRDMLGGWRGGPGRVAGVVAAVVVPVVSGLWVISSEPLMVFGSTAVRFHAAFTKSLVYRL